MATASAATAHHALGSSAIEQILDRQNKPMTQAQRKDLIAKVERSCRRFDKRGKGRLDAAEFYNAVKLQNKLECTKDDMHKLLEDLDLDKDNRASIKDFLEMPVISRDVFDAMDRNKDGFVSKGELKLAAKNMSLKELVTVIDKIDKDSDGRLSFEEVKAINKSAHLKATKDK